MCYLIKWCGVEALHRLCIKTENFIDFHFWMLLLPLSQLVFSVFYFEMLQYIVLFWMGIYLMLILLFRLMNLPLYMCVLFYHDCKLVVVCWISSIPTFARSSNCMYNSIPFTAGILSNLSNMIFTCLFVSITIYL